MDNHKLNTKIISLLQKYIENRCDEHELRTLLYWLKSPDSSDDFDFISESLWGKLAEKYTYPDESRIAVLDQEVDILLRKVKTKQVSPKSEKGSRRLFIYRAAAIFLVLVSVSIGYFSVKNTDVIEEIVYKEITTSRGETKEYTLDDGSHIVLNSGSKLRIPSNYNKENRSVEMIGEVFFDVTSNPQKPFIIKSGSTQVKVLGTSFNVKAYPEDNTIGVTVSTGKVLVNVADIDLQLRVLPMEHLVVYKETGSLTKSSLSENNYTRWMEGHLYFYKEPLSEVIKIINRKYDKDVVLHCKDCNPLISGSHDNKSLEAVIEAICFTTGLKYRENNGSIILYD